MYLTRALGGAWGACPARARFEALRRVAPGIAPERPRRSREVHTPTDRALEALQGQETADPSASARPVTPRSGIEARPRAHIEAFI